MLNEVHFIPVKPMVTNITVGVILHLIWGTGFEV